MNVLVIAGNNAQFHDYCREMRINPAAAICVQSPDQLRGLDPEHVRIVLYGTYRDNPAYQSDQYRWLVESQRAA